MGPWGRGPVTGGGERSVKLCVGGGGEVGAPLWLPFILTLSWNLQPSTLGSLPHHTADFSSLVFDSVPVICDLFVTVLFVKSFVDPSRTISKGGAGRASLGKSAVRRFRSVSVKCKVTKYGNFLCYISKMGCLLK
jgi:hypothetical protein